MAGNVAGGKAAAATNKARFGEDFYSKIGAMGGKNSNTGGFAHAKAMGNLDFIREQGAKGGSISRRGKVANGK